MTYLTVQEVADYLKVKQTTVRKWCREGRLSYYTFSGCKGFRFVLADIEKFIQSHRQPCFAEMMSKMKK